MMVKLLFAFGGKFVPVQKDGMLRYVDGEYRLITVKRDVTFDELNKKLADIYGHDMEIRYQISGEDLSVRILVESDDDLQIMIDEYDKLVRASADGSPHLWVFLSVAPPRKAVEVLDEIHQHMVPNPAPKSSDNTVPVVVGQHNAAVLCGENVGWCYFCERECKDDDNIRNRPCQRHKCHSSCSDNWLEHDYGRCSLCRLKDFDRKKPGATMRLLRRIINKPLWKKMLML